MSKIGRNKKKTKKFSISFVKPLTREGFGAIIRVQQHRDIKQVV